jgi:hypothetical protein
MQPAVTSEVQFQAITPEHSNQMIWYGRIDVYTANGSRLLKQEFSDHEFQKTIEWARDWHTTEDLVPSRVLLIPVSMVQTWSGIHKVHHDAKAVPIDDLFDDDCIVMARLSII